MSAANKYKEIMRCPVCFSREIDVLLIPEGGGNHYCVKCGFRGNEDLIRSMYADIKKKYQWMDKRLTMEEQLKM